MSGITASSFWTALSAPSPSPDNPRREILLGSVAAAVFFVGLCGWAAFARMDAATNASGVVVVSGHRQSVQSRDGGIVSSLRVKEGDHVQAGQVLVEFAPAEAIAEERALTERVIGLKAQIARLEAEQMGAASITAPAEFASLSADDKVIAEHAMALEAHALASSRGADAARRGTLNQRQAEAEQQIIGYQRQLAANARQQQLNADELKGMKELAARGYAPATRVRALEQSAAGLEGDAGSQAAEIARLNAVRGEARLESLQGDNERARQISDEMHRAQADLQANEPQLQAARDRLKRTEAVAPVSGAVTGLTVNTVGAVVAQGQRLMEVVPDKLPLVIEAQVAPRDANDLKVGQETQVRFTAVHGRNVPILHGQLTRISPDSVVEERTGRAYFVADITVPQSELALIGDKGEALRPGMPADVVVPLRKRTALEYWLEPLTQTLWRSFHEH
ncbi:HlyD family type I secretion periplasmic adaptor subunit [Phenylobacterium montanum]|uniref:Membrane fusion protein (MFP) family protein n=1 Tax=Phenylobacterium montanum TaxID=2823693 RepID=A0A975FWL0_9CAUL|nr:HlyD family type I secretion periplasmic adaptor subunit [Caulobacter sp. S6]QUD86481.1 HlyD family type I secretion periplasmic adaptor subunit [Caulobacter sp. S6]